jgi:hypothetical protein
VVAAGSATGFVVPPLFILPGKRVNRNVLDVCSVDSATVTTTVKGFMNASIFRQWLIQFERNVPQTVKRLLLLVYDGYSMLKAVSIMLPVTCELHKMLKMKRTCVDAFTLY